MRSRSAKRMVGKWINVPKRQDFRFWPISLKKSVSNFEINQPAIRRPSIANR